jgi:hypothetical protein
MPLVYDELRRIAASYVRNERPGQTIQATALVNEAFVRLASERARHFNSRTHFLAIAALSMRQILVQRARSRRRSNAAAVRSASLSTTRMRHTSMPRSGHPSMSPATSTCSRSTRHCPA